MDFLRNDERARGSLHQIGAHQRDDTFSARPILVRSTREREILAQTRQRSAGDRDTEHDDTSTHTGETTRQKNAHADINQRRMQSAISNSVVWSLQREKKTHTSHADASL